MAKNKVKLNYEDAHKFVNKNTDLGFFWQGWNIVKWTENPNGFTQKNGMFRNEKWGHAMTIPLESDGTWSVLEQYV
jgi:hypothetical protein